MRSAPITMNKKINNTPINTLKGLASTQRASHCRPPDPWLRGSKLKVQHKSVYKYDIYTFIYLWDRRGSADPSDIQRKIYLFQLKSF